MIICPTGTPGMLQNSPETDNQKSRLSTKNVHFLIPRRPVRRGPLAADTVAGLPNCESCNFWTRDSGLREKSLLADNALRKLPDTPADTPGGGGRRPPPPGVLDSVSWILPERVSRHFEGPGESTHSENPRDSQYY